MEVNYLKTDKTTLTICIALPLVIGALSALLTRKVCRPLSKQTAFISTGMDFPNCWTILYVLMGISSYLVVISDQPNDKALSVYFLQLAFNFFWSILFFNLHWYLISFIWLVVLWFLILITIVMFYKISKPAAYLLIPYFLWVTFAGYLNLAIYTIQK
ncbi:MAG: TspO/MBR family protein [Eubacterium sp.]